MDRTMRSLVTASATVLLMSPVFTGCTDSTGRAEEDGSDLLAEGTTLEEMEERLRQFAPVTIDFDESLLAERERAAVVALVEASRILDGIFLRQVHPDNPEWRQQIARRAESDTAWVPVLEYFDIMYGPWDRLEDGEPFLAMGPKPEGAAYYPEGLGASELETWMEEHPEESEAFRSYFTVIRRTGEGGLEAVPYSEFYRERLEEAASWLRRAASEVENESLRTYLELRADAFLSNDYFESDMAWMDISGSAIEPTIGPYEVYEDDLMGYKAAFESFVTLNDPAASAQLERLKDYLPQLEGALPIPDEHKNTQRGFESPIRVVDVIFTAGDTRAGVQTLAFNLPNDERVREAKGSKKVMLRNVARAKFDQILRPIADTTLATDLSERVAFEPWFTAVLMHELAHGLGPGTITRSSGEQTTVNQALRDRYSAIEELKADVVGLHSLTVLRDEGVYGEDFVRSAFASHLGDLFRAVRFGASEAHGQANLIQFNYLWEEGALSFDPESGRFVADLEAVEEANRALASEVLTLQAEGSYERAGTLLERHGREMGAELQSALASLRRIPVDVRPHYTVIEKMRAWPRPAAASDP